MAGAIASVMLFATPVIAQDSRLSLADRVAQLEQQSQNKDQNGIGMVNQMQQLQAQVQQLQGQIEELQHSQQQLDDKNKAQFADSDARLQRLESAGAAAPAKPASAPATSPNNAPSAAAAPASAPAPSVPAPANSPGASADYDVAFKAIRAGIAPVFDSSVAMAQHVEQQVQELSMQIDSLHLSLAASSVAAAAADGLQADLQRLQAQQAQQGAAHGATDQRLTATQAMLQLAQAQARTQAQLASASEQRALHADKLEVELEEATAALQAQDTQRCALEDGLRSSRLQLQSVMQDLAVTASRLLASEGRCTEVETLLLTKSSQLSAVAAAVSRLEQQQVATGSESATLLESALSEVASLRAASLEGRAELAAAQLAASRAAQEAERWGSEHGAGLVAVGAAEAALVTAQRLLGEAESQAQASRLSTAAAHQELAELARQHELRTAQAHAVQAASHAEMQRERSAHGASVREVRQLLGAADAHVDELQGQLIGQRMAVDAAEDKLASAKLAVDGVGRRDHALPGGVVNWVGSKG
ncbi:MAG: hypothetical protein WDW36_008856 [Sanguina aurantia]